MRVQPSSTSVFARLFLFILLPILAITIGCGGVSNTGSGPTLSSIAVTPATPSIAVGATQQFTATGSYSDGSTQNLTGSVTWSSGTAATATIGASSGLATAVAAGTSTITATSGTVSGTATLTVTAATKTLTSIAITPASASIAVGATQQFTATGTYSDNSTANITGSVTWTSGTPATATIGATTGLATAVAAGTSSITASLSGVTSNTATLTVTAPVKTLTSIAITPASASIAVGATQQFTATGTYSDGSTAPITTSVTWTSGTPATATIGATTGLATAVAAGTSSITASLSGITSNTATLTVSAAAKTLTTIAITPATPSIAVGATQQFTATGTYSDGSTGNITTSVTWTSGTPATATIGASSGLATAVAAGTSSITASLSGVTSNTATLTVTAGPTVTSIAVTPASANFAMNATQQFTATATYSDSSTGDVTSTATWSIANTSVATIDSTTGLATGVATGTTSVTATLGSVSGNTTFAVTIAPGTGVNVPTWHNDNSRTGLNANEVSLTPSNVSAMSFGKLFSYQTDGYAYGEPLLMSNVTIGGTAHNVVYVATEHDSVYAFDADNYGTGAPLWHTSLLQAGETPMTNGPVQPFQGVTSTPVIDASTSTIYVVSAQVATGSAATFRLSALDITTGAQKFGGPVTITASVPGNNSDATATGNIDNLTTSCVQRAALLLANGNVYIGFGGCHAGWLLSYDKTSLAQTGKFDISPNNNGEGEYASAGGVWMGAGGPVADAAGNIYITTGNGPFVPTSVPVNPPLVAAGAAGAWADSVLKFSPTTVASSVGPMLVLEDYFTPADYQFMDCNDSDLAAGGLLMVPPIGTAPAQLVTGGKMGKLYFLNAANLGKENGPPNTSTTGTNSSPTTDDGALQTLEWGAAAPGQSSPLIQDYLTSPGCTDPSGTHVAVINPFEIFGTSAYFNNSIYLGITPTAVNIPSGIRQFTYSGGAWTAGAYTSEYTQENTRGTTPFISANGTSNGILWMIDQGQPLQTPASGGPTNATLRAYDATNLGVELYNSATNLSDTPGYGIKFSSPVVGNGKVYINTGHDLTTVTNPKGELDVYGLN